MACSVQGILKEAGQVNSKVKSMLIIFFDIMGIVHKEFVLARQTVKSAYYCETLQRLRKNVQRLRPKPWRQKKWLLHHNNTPSHTSFFMREFLTKNMTCSRSLYFSVSLIEDKIEKPQCLHN
jgi:hypothetical protein